MSDSSGLMIAMVVGVVVLLGFAAFALILALGGGVLLFRGREAEPPPAAPLPPAPPMRSPPSIPESMPRSPPPRSAPPTPPPRPAAQQPRNPIADDEDDDVRTMLMPGSPPLSSRPPPSRSAAPPPLASGFGPPINPGARKSGLLGFFDEPGSEPNEGAKTELFQKGKTPAWLADDSNDEGEATEIFSAHHVTDDEDYAEALEEEAARKRK